MLVNLELAKVGFEEFVASAERSDGILEEHMA